MAYSFADDFDLIVVNVSLVLGEDLYWFEQIVQLYPRKVLLISDMRSLSIAIKAFNPGADYAEKRFEPSRIIELVQVAYRTN